MIFICKRFLWQCKVEFWQCVIFHFPIDRILGHGNVKKVNKDFFIFFDVYIARIILNTKNDFDGNVKSGYWQVRLKQKKPATTQF